MRPRGSSVSNYYEALASIAGAGERQDGWANANTGFGVEGIDRTIGAQFYADSFLDPWMCANLFHCNDVARRIITVFPEEATKREPELQGEHHEALKARLDELDVLRKIKRGAMWGLGMGGGLGVLWIDDGLPSDQPVDPKRAHKIRDLTVYDRRTVERVARFDQTRAGQEGLYANAKLFRVTPTYGGEFTVHRDRCLVFGGMETGDFERETLGGWDTSILQAAYNVLCNFDAGYSALSHLLTDASQPVITISGLVKALGQKAGRAFIQKRAELINLTRSLIRTVFLDADAGEKFERVNAQFAGIPDAIDRLGNRLALATGIPVTILMGQAPAGLSATGESDTRAWYSKVSSYRQDAIESHYKRLVQLLAPGHKVVWPPLWEPTAKEQAETRKLDAEADATYIDTGVVTPEEVALTRKGPRDVKIDPRLRRPRAMPATSAAPPPGARPGAASTTTTAAAPPRDEPQRAADRGHPDSQSDDGPRQ